LEAHQKARKMNRLYDLKIPVIGITGGIASGKSTVSKILMNQGEHVICADSIVKEIYQQDSTKNLIQRIAGKAIDDKNEINFKILRDLFFQNKQIKLELENHIHPQIERYFKDKMKSDLQRIFYDVPLLFEKKMESKFDYIILVKVNEETQLERLTKRDNIGPELAKKIIKNQLHFTEKEKRSDFIIDNNQDQSELEQKTLLILKQI